jgi:nitric oxide reductase subunit B
MVLLDLFPAGMLQLNAVLEQGLCFARSQTFQSGTAFQTLTWLRIVGGSIFVVGGVVPLLKFVIANFPFSLQRQNRVESQVGQTSILEGVDPVH